MMRLIFKKKMCSYSESPVQTRPQVKLVYKFTQLKEYVKSPAYCAVLMVKPVNKYVHINMQSISKMQHKYTCPKTRVLVI